MKNIRNFCIIAHIDHGKSTLADRFLEFTKTVDERKMKAQILDQMDLERERGITIKLQPVRMNYGNGYILNLIDTPGHVDFSYEVSRSLAAVEGAVLLVDASQGIQAQTLANLYLALSQDLTIIPVINKIDLPSADIQKTKQEIIKLLGCFENEILLASGKTGQGILEILKAITERVPAPFVLEKEIPRALIFDSYYDDFRGVVAYVRVISGEIKKGEKISMLGTGARAEVLDIGYLRPNLESSGKLEAGDIGYIVTSVREVSECRVGDTITTEETKKKKEVEALDGYEEAKPMVFAGIFTKSGEDWEKLREAMARLKLSDASLIYEPEHNPTLGFGFRSGFLGMLHLDIIQERIKREYDLDILITVPSVAYRVKLKDGSEIQIKNASDFLDPSKIEEVMEPIMSVDIVTPSEYAGAVMQLAQAKRGVYKNTEYLDEGRAILHYDIPLSMLLVDFYDKLKSISSGYASLNYDFSRYEKTEVVKMDILIAEEKIEALSSIVYRDGAYGAGKKIVETLKEEIPKQMFVIKVQAAIGGKVIAAERISAMRKDVTANLYGGDVTRKRKLLEKQKKGKKKMMDRGQGKVDIPSSAYISVLKR